MKKIIIVLLLLIVNCQLSICQIGTWRNYLAYHDVQEIQSAGDDIFVLASNGLYQYNKNDQSIVTYDRVNGLSDTYITHIRWCPKAKRLVAVYQNSNIDLVEPNGNIINISDLYTKVMTGDKTVSSIRIDGVYAYLICGFGIVKVNVQRAEIAESYTPNNPEYPTSLPADDNSDYEKYIDLVKTLNPDGPKNNYFGFMKFTNGKLYTSNGDLESPGAIQVLKDNKWILYQSEGISDITGVSYQGAYCLDIDPSDENHIFAGSRNGLYEFRNEKFVKFYNSTNSPIEPVNGKSKNYQLVTGVKYDKQGNLWLLNSQAPTSSLIRLKDGQFTKFNHQEWMKLTDSGVYNKSNGNLSQILIDSRGLMWFVNDHFIKPGYYRYDMDIDKAYAYENFVNQDGTTIQNLYAVKCVTEDLENNLWIGTDQGPFMIEKASILNGEAPIIQVKVPRNDGTNFADYLLSGLNITNIAIDGGGRKWFATNGNGVYLISADNMTQLQHFTTDNSKLLSNSVMSVAINQTSGEVFFGTDKGLCSYISDATETNTEMTSDNVWAYPNPVEPGYTGPITITGLTLNADIKILSANGAVVNEGRSNGGTYIWDGCDKKGRRVTSGIYMVATATNKGEKGTVCKIAIVN